LELPQIGEGFSEVGDELIFLGSLDHYIIYVGLNVLPDLRLQALLNCLLICCSSVFQPESHNLVAIDAMGRYERCFIFIVRVQSYLVISRVGVEEAE
jgi:hypothetical protein